MDEMPGMSYYPVIIIGGGLGGIAMACRLQGKLKRGDFTLLEKGSSLGGTWWINRYPGVACDIPGVWYSFSFRPKPDWTHLYPSGAEIGDYIHEVAAEYDIPSSTQLNTEVLKCEWDDRSKRWIVTIRRLIPKMGDLTNVQIRVRIQENGEAAVYVSKEERISCKVLISAVGALEQPRDIPSNIPGIDTFKGELIQAARWPHDASANLRDKNVLIVGAGCSSAQIVPALLQPDVNVAKITQLMREPHWVVERTTLPITESQRIFLSKYVPGFMGLLRWVCYIVSETDYQALGDTWWARFNRSIAARASRAFIARAAPEKYHTILTPSYDFGCKRRVFDSPGGWFNSMFDERYDLTTLGLSSVQPHSVTLVPNTKTHPCESKVPERTVPVDAIILATGYSPSKWFHQIRLAGADGRDLHDEFSARGGPQMYRSTAIDGFPNFFVIGGPNSFTNTASHLQILEDCVKHALPLVEGLATNKFETVEVKRTAVDKWTAAVQAALKRKVWETGGCTNWIKDGKKWNSVGYPFSITQHMITFLWPNMSDWHIVKAEKDTS